jgi:S-DNA-T family DNA segregation ATPase FtsK/SpoIIIE
VSGSGPGAGPGPDAGLGPARALLVIDALEHLDARASIPRALLAGRGRPTRAIILAEHASQLPPGCGAVLTVTEDGAATVSEPGRERVVTGILATGITAATARRTARHLAVLEDAAAGGAPDGVHLVDLIGFGPSGSMADDIERRWKAWAGTGRTTIPLGRTTDSEVLEVDLRADGPHAFVAGTAGAATTELLRGVLLGAATSFDPSRLAFVLVDTEGAGTFGRCAELPHVAAALVGPDAGLGSRALRRVLAELQRREDQAAPIRAGEAPRAVPARLLVVVDAFDTLVAENPDLVPTVVDLARRGGPLGIHLLLVTRHNDSILAGSIRAVTSLRLAPAAREPDQALRLLSSDAGPDVPVDDRWFVRLGSGDLAAFRRVSVSGTRAMEGARAPLDVRPLLLKPSHAPTTRITITAAGRTVGPAPLTDLDLVVGAIGELAARRGMAAVPLPGPDGLPEQVELAAVVGTDPARRWAVPLGIAESAGRLRPSPYRWDTTHGSLVVVGSSPSETALAVAAATVGLASRYPAANLEIHVLDTPTGRLSALAGLPHGGSVTAADDVVAVRTVVEHLEGLLERRTPGERHRLALVVVGDLGALVAACRGAGDTELAARLVRVVRAGWGVDVLAVVGATQVADVPTELWRNVEQRLVLSLDRTSDWRALGLAAPDGPLAPLRAIDAATGLRVQLASFPGDDVANGVAAAAAAGTGEP